MPANPTPQREPLQADPPRRALHTIIAVAGWIVFVYWWWLVFRRVNATEVRYTMWFIAIALVGITFVTALWSLHNVRIFKRLGPRTKLREVREDFSRDMVGRPVGMPTVPDEVLRADIVMVRIVGGRKVYEPVRSSGLTPVPGELKVVS